MFIIRRASNSDRRYPISVSPSRYAIYVCCALIISSAGLTSCGQKGELYIAQPSQTSDQMIVTETASEALDSTRQPQDAAFATIDDDGYDKTRYLEQKQVMPAVSNDPNDY